MFETRYRVNRCSWCASRWAIQRWRWWFPVWLEYRGLIHTKQDAIDLIQTLKITY
jgi:hypothetical protein